jgi:PBSX family phage portal protein
VTRDHLGRPTEEQVFVVGERQGTQAGDRDFVWEEIGSHDGTRGSGLRGLETEAVAGTTVELDGKIADAYREGRLDRISLKLADSDSGPGSQQTDDAENPDRTHTTVPTLTQSVRGYIRPPYDPSSLATFRQKNGTHDRCVSSKASSTGGSGFDVVSHASHGRTDDDGGDDDGDDEAPEGEEQTRDFWFGRDTVFQLGPNDQQVAPDDILEATREDVESIGYGAIEFWYNRQGEPVGAAHVPAQNIRRRTDDAGPGFVALDSIGRIKEFYAPLGARPNKHVDEDDRSDESYFVDRWTGEKHETREGAGTAANELLFIQNYSSISPNYGLPDWISQAPTIVADGAAKRYNARLLENDGVPRFIVAVEGGKLTDRAYDELREKLRDLSEEENTGRGILIEAERIVEGEDVSVRIEPLTVGVEEDHSWGNFREANEKDIGASHGCPPAIYNPTDNNYSNQWAQLQNYARETIEPLQERFAELIYRAFHVRVLGAPGVTLDFHHNLAQNDKRQAEVAQTKWNAGGQFAMTFNEVRESIGLEPETDEDDEPTSLGEMSMFKIQQRMAGGGGGGSTPADDSPTTTETPEQLPATPGPAASEPATATRATTAADPNPDYSLFGDGVDNAHQDASRPLEAAKSSKHAAYEAGDTVEYRDGQQGMVVEVWTSGTVSWPVGEEDSEDVETDTDDPLYLVVRATGGSELFNESELAETDDFLSDATGGDPGALAEDGETAKLYDAVEDPSDPAEWDTAKAVIHKLNLPGVDDPEVGFSSLPNGWTRLSVLKAWRSLGMSFTSCVADMQGEIRSPKRWCAAMKDEVLMTERWRGRF